MRGQDERPTAAPDGEVERWEFPDWLRPYVLLLRNTGGTYGRDVDKAVEFVTDLMNSSRQTLRTNTIRMSLYVACESQIGLLYRLIHDGLLPAPDSLTERQAEFSLDGIRQRLDELRLTEDITELRREVHALVEVAEAADYYANWHDPRIVPTVEWPDQRVALERLRTRLERFGLSFQSPLTASRGDAPNSASGSSRGVEGER